MLVLPGLAAGNASTMLLRAYLRVLGHEAQPWEAGVNCGRDVQLLKVQDSVQSLADRHGQPVALVGWSLGGIQARQIAKLLPQQVRQVVTLGSPFNGPPRASHAWRLYEWLSGKSAENAHRAHADLAEPPPVPNSAIASRSDGIVAGPASVNPDSATRRTASENIWVHASHTGLGLNPAALYAVADRLAQARGQWQAFDPPAALHCWYDTPPVRPVG